MMIAVSSYIKSTIFVIAAICSGCATVPLQSDMGSNDPLQGSCLSSIKLPADFIAVTSDFDSQLGNWYKDLFDLEVVKTFEMPDGRARGELMARDDFVVELFYQKDALSRSDQVPSAKSAQWKGFAKIGIFVDTDIRELKPCLLEGGISAGRIFQDDNLNVDLLLVRDPEGNVIEFIEKH